jgi:2-iminobutanoate/2-iminopropanoate deaminase
MRCCKPAVQRKLHRFILCHEDEERRHGQRHRSNQSRHHGGTWGPLQPRGEGKRFRVCCRSAPIAHDGAKLMDAPFEQQAQQTLDNIAAALKAAGSAIDRLVQVRVYVTDIGSWPAFNTIFATWIGTSRPARAVVPVPQLHYGFKIEIEAVALEGSP